MKIPSKKRKLAVIVAIILIVSSSGIFVMWYVFEHDKITFSQAAERALAFIRKDETLKDYEIKDIGTTTKEGGLQSNGKATVWYFYLYNSSSLTQNHTSDELYVVHVVEVRTDRITYKNYIAAWNGIGYPVLDENALKKCIDSNVAMKIAYENPDIKQFVDKYGNCLELIALKRYDTYNITYHDYDVPDRPTEYPIWEISWYYKPFLGEGAYFAKIWLNAINGETLHVDADLSGPSSLWPSADLCGICYFWELPIFATVAIVLAIWVWVRVRKEAKIR